MEYGKRRSNMVETLKSNSVCVQSSNPVAFRPFILNDRAKKAKTYSRIGFLRSVTFFNPLKINSKYYRIVSIITKLHTSISSSQWLLNEICLITANKFITYLY